MGFLKSTVVGLIAVALMSYGFDCLAMTTPKEAMQCCTTMHCSPQEHHGQDCCNASRSVRLPFVTSASVHTVSLNPAPSVEVAADKESPRALYGFIAMSAHCHAPPRSHGPTLTPIRI
jgi:hypothetical protein